MNKEELRKFNEYLDRVINESSVNESKQTVRVYHGSSNKNLRFNPNKPLMFFTTDKLDAESWAERNLLGGKRRNTGNYVYTADLTFEKLYEPGSAFNPKYDKYKDGEEQELIWDELFFNDINERNEELVRAGFDCFHIDMGDGLEYYIIPYQKRQNIRWVDKEEI